MSPQHTNMSWSAMATVGMLSGLLTGGAAFVAAELPADSGDVQERAVPRKGEIFDMPGTSSPGGRLPIAPGGSKSTAPSSSAPSTGTGGTSSVVGGVLEPD